MNTYFLYIFAFWSALILTIIIESKLLPVLKKSAKQPIYSEGPSWHLSKKGTPTMGGIAFVVAITIVLLFTAIIMNQGIQNVYSVVITALFALGNSMIGFFDDLTKLLRNKNAGLSPLQKIFLQLILSILFLMARRYYLDDETSFSLWFGKINLGILYYPFSLILLLGVINCANLTDGIDGLASSVAAVIGAVFLFLSANHNVASSLISLTLIGGTLGFLLFNNHPAKVFMGDTGSLFLGAMVASVAFSLGNPLIIILLGSVYVIEGVSVILQVDFYKLTKKRLFKMAPLHHHLEKSGFSENQICVIMAIITLLSSSLIPLIFRW